MQVAKCGLTFPRYRWEGGPPANVLIEVRSEEEQATAAGLEAILWTMFNFECNGYEHMDNKITCFNSDGIQFMTWNNPALFTVNGYTVSKHSSSGTP